MKHGRPLPLSLLRKFQGLEGRCARSGNDDHIRVSHHEPHDHSTVWAQPPKAPTRSICRSRGRLPRAAGLRPHTLFWEAGPWAGGDTLGNPVTIQRTSFWLHKSGRQLLPPQARVGLCRGGEPTAEPRRAPSPEQRGRGEGDSGTRSAPCPHPPARARSAMALVPYALRPHLLPCVPVQLLPQPSRSAPLSGAPLSSSGCTPPSASSSHLSKLGGHRGFQALGRPSRQLQAQGRRGLSQLPKPFGVTLSAHGAAVHLQDHVSPPQAGLSS